MLTDYIKPVERILSKEDLDKWIDSETFNSVLDFIKELQDLVVGLTNDATVEGSESTERLMKALDKVEGIIQENPVVVEKDISRFGKVEFHDFYDQVGQQMQNILGPVIEQMYPDKAPLVELAVYFNESWGDRSRIDYGSGHELNFICFLLCLQRLNIFEKKHYSFVVLKVFTKYMQIMRNLQKCYWLEPAGSHGVWGLDDYHFLPFLFGASQLSTHPHLKPKLIHNEEMVDCFYQKYMYMECIHFINNIKTLPKNQTHKLSLRWHSPMLDDILSARSWAKIKEGMIKMYRVEVLSKLPIIQHFMFGSLIPCPPGVSEHQDHPQDDGNCKHVHDLESLNTWGDCCGIRIPSAIAASESLKMKNQIPFD
ncbi:uncharacterized protein PRCAT00004867001 [Priceomyces carsonii]|uniref:uncharacterized protein n=1 Tax=Priceomyces carsonii TaxID=28549 RepID=UPI002EDB994F|nr:unnamed protein product [Priceomyces carsonii]